MVLSSPPLINWALTICNDLIPDVWPRRTRSSSQVSMSHILMVVSYEPDARMLFWKSRHMTESSVVSIFLGASARTARIFQFVPTLKRDL